MSVISDLTQAFDNLANIPHRPPILAIYDTDGSFFNECAAAILNLKRIGPFDQFMVENNLFGPVLITDIAEGIATAERYVKENGLEWAKPFYNGVVELQCLNPSSPDDIFLSDFLMVRGGIKEYSAAVCLAELPLRKEEIDLFFHVEITYNKETQEWGIEWVGLDCDKEGKHRLNRTPEDPHGLNSKEPADAQT